MTLGRWPDFSEALLVLGTAFVATVLLTPVVRSGAVRFGLVGKPVEDRWGKRVTARLGGVAIFLGFVIASLWWVPLDRLPMSVFLGGAAVFLLGLMDDIRRFPPYTKLFVQLLIGCLVVLGGVHIELIRWPWLSIPLSVLWFVLVMNAFNLLDNMDGLAAGIGALAATFCAFHAIFAHQVVVATLGIALAGACLGFLRFNFPPAKIYMGDSGSHFLGLSLAILALLGSWRHSTQLLSVLAVPVLVLAVPIFDTCFVTIQRLVHRRHPFTGGTDHVSHRLVILGLSVRQTVVALYVVSACLGLLSVVSVTLDPLPALAIWLLVLTSLLLFGVYLGQVNVYRVVPPTATSEESAPAGRTTFIQTMLFHKRRLVEILVDFCLICSAYVFAHVLRFEGVLTAELQRLIVRSLPMILVIKLSCFMSCGLYRGMWRYLGLRDLIMVFRAVTLGSLLSSIALLYLWRFEGYSRAALFIDWMLCFLGVAGSRIAERLLDEWIWAAREGEIPVLIIGAGDGGERVLRYLHYDQRSGRRAVAFLDDDVKKFGSLIHGVPIIGTRAQLAHALSDYGVREVLIAIADPPGDLLQHVQQCCAPHGVTWKVVTAGVTDAV